MEITCPRCQSLHEIDPPASARARGPRSLKFRCSHCGHTFTVDPQPAPEPEAAPPPLGEASGAEPVNLVQVDGKIWSVPDVGALHRWVLERRIDPDALVSNHGMRWTRAGDREDLAVFFTGADALAFRERNLRDEAPPMDDEIIVDGMDAESDGSGAMPVSVGPHPDALGRVDLDTMIVDFANPREDTQEQTMHSMGVDETPIPGVPEGYGRVDAAPEPTERLAAPAGVALPSSVGGPGTPNPGPFPLGVATVTPGAAPPGSAAHSQAMAADPASAETIKGGVWPSGPAVGASQEPGTLVPPAPVGPPAPRPTPQVARSAAGHSELSASASQGFFVDSNTAAPGPSPGEHKHRDVFEDPPTGARSGGTGLWIGLAVAAVLLVVGYFALRPNPIEDPTAARTAAETAQGAGAGVVPLPKAEVPGAVPAEKAAADKALADKAVADKAVADKAAADKAVADKAAADKAVAAKAAADKAAADKAAADKRAAARSAATTTGASTGGTRASSGGSPSKLIASGWKAIEGGDFNKAHSLFDRALAGGANGDALYGRGYANEKLGDSVSASDDYCHALAVGGVSVEIKREIEGGLRRVGRACN